MIITRSKPKELRSWQVWWYAVPWWTEAERKKTMVETPRKVRPILILNTYADDDMMDDGKDLSYPDWVGASSKIDKRRDEGATYEVGPSELNDFHMSKPDVFMFKWINWNMEKLGVQAWEILKYGKYLGTLPVTTQQKILRKIPRELRELQSYGDISYVPKFPSIRQPELDESLNVSNSTISDYFKNSKIRDDKGNLLICYHGTPYPGFTVFDPRKAQSQFGKYKFHDFNINYFTTNFDTAAGYTEFGIGDIIGKQTGNGTTTQISNRNNVYACYLNIVNPYIIDEDTKDELRSWRSLKDDKIRKLELATFKQLYNKWNGWDYEDVPIENVLDELNHDLSYFNTEVVQDDDTDYYNLIQTNDNSLYGGSTILMYQYDTVSELFNDKELLEKSLIGNPDDIDDYWYTIDYVIGWVLKMNEEQHTDYDGIIVKDITDIGPHGSMFDSRTTDIITLKSSNQIKVITNMNPTDADDINEAVENTFHMSKEKLSRIKKDPYFKSYKLETVPIKQLIDDNNLLNSDELNYHEAVWGDESGKVTPDTFTYIKNKDNDVNDIIYGTRRNNKIRLSNGKHRLRALYNDGYKQIELPILTEQLIESAAIKKKLYQRVSKQRPYHHKNKLEEKLNLNKLNIHWWYDENHDSWNPTIMVKGKKTRLRVGVMIIKEGNKILLGQEEGEEGVFSLPGGAVNRDETLEEAGVREVEEEVHLEVQNPQYTGIDYCVCHEDVLPWVKENVPEDEWWYNYYTCIVIADYKEKYVGDVADKDEDPTMKNTSHFYDIIDVVDDPSFKPEWKAVLIKYKYLSDEE